MKPGEPSRTAEHMALFRALESSRPKERLFDDPFAELFLRPPFRLLLLLARARPLRVLVDYSIDVAGPGARSSAIARTRLIDDTVRSALDDGVQQIVILGAGFDCRAYRMPGMERIRVHVPYVGGNFGAKHGSRELMAAAAMSMRLGRPVRPRRRPRRRRCPPARPRW